MKVRFSVDNGKRRSRRIVVVMKHCGNVSIRVDKVKIYDYLNIFAAKVGKKLRSAGCACHAAIDGSISRKDPLVQ